MPQGEPYMVMGPDGAPLMDQSGQPQLFPTVEAAQQAASQVGGTVTDMQGNPVQGGFPNDPLLEALLGQAGGPQSGPPMGPEQIAMNGGEQMPPMPGMPPGGPGMPPGMPPGGPPMPGMPPM